MNIIVIPSALVLLIIAAVAMSAVMISMSTTPPPLPVLPELISPPALMAAPPDVRWENNEHIGAHGFDTAAMWDRCPNKQLGLQRPTDLRWGFPCEIEGEWYIFISEDDGFGVTGFRNKAKSLEDAITYLVKRGYTILP